MSAQPAQAAAPANQFSASLVLAAGVTAYIHAPTMHELQHVVAKLQPTEPAATGTSAPKAAAPAPTPAPQPEPTAGNASASTATPASAPPADSGSAAAADAPRPTYDDVKARVLALAKAKGRDAAAATLKSFGVDNANKLKLEQYPGFIAAADKLLLEAA